MYRDSGVPRPANGFPFDIDACVIGETDMTHNVKPAVLFAGMLLAMLSLSSPANAEACTPHDQVCSSHATCDTGDALKHCRDTLKSDGYHCECRRGKDDRPHEPGFGIGGIGIGIGIGGHSTGGRDDSHDRDKGGKEPGPSDHPPVDDKDKDNTQQNPDTPH
jgi:hypothetical protein